MGCSSSKETVSATAPPRSQGRVEAGARAAGVSTRSLGSSAKGEVNPSVVMVMDLNDVVPPAEDDPQGRSRFLSYASGASTPNTSQTNISWDANSENGDSRKKPNPKLLRSSGSKINLDELHSTDGAGLSSKVVHIEVPFGMPIEEVYDGVHNGRVLGSGVAGIVRLVTHKKTLVQYAVKCLDLGLVGTKEGLAQLREEIFIMCQLDHPNIVRLEEVYESHSEIYLVQELCLGGELFDRLDEQPDYRYTEAECARLVKQMLSAVRYLHSKGIIHRDLKLENFLFSSRAEDSELKMIDFGLSKHFVFGEILTAPVGTPYTVAPEVIEGKYDERCDIWAIGVITYLLLSGDPPFGGCGGPEPMTKVRDNILTCNYKFEPQDIWGHVSENGKDFIRHMLVVDPKKRPTARAAQKDPWLKEWASRSSNQDDKILNPNVVKALVSFKEFNHVRKMLSEVLSFTLLPDQITELRKEFETLDTDGSGEISLAGLKQVLVTNAGAGSLGAMTEEEVEDIFNAMRVNKAETRIHWHEFIAAGLSQCQVDDRNLRLAFDRLDRDHKGYITLDDIINLVGDDDMHPEEEMRMLWTESMKSVDCSSQHIAYDSFVLLMKGQTKEPELPVPSLRLTSLSSLQEDESESEPVSPEKGVSSPQVDSARVYFLDTAGHSASLSSLPNMAGPPLHEISSSTLGEPLSGDNVIDEEAHETLVDLHDMSRPLKLLRGRSKSLAEESEFGVEPTSQKETRRAHALPEHDAKVSQPLPNQSSVATSRQFYRAHRQMRMAVMDVSRRFEEEQTRRARDSLMAEKAKEAGMMGLGQAGLVMRHGHKVHVTTDAIRDYLEKDKAEKQQLVEKATRRGGRGRGNRKKTISDMSAMMNASLGQDELSIIAAKAGDPYLKTAKTDFNATLPDLAESVDPAETITMSDLRQSAPETYGPPIDVVDVELIRKATVPGEFHQTKDPFRSGGMYGRAPIGAPVSIAQGKKKEDSKV